VQARNIIISILNPTNCDFKIVCAEYPSAEYAPFVPIRWPINSVIKYSTVDVSNVCINNVALTECIDKAFCAWTSLCPSANLDAIRMPASNNDFNIIQIKPSTNANDFQPNPKNGTAVTKRKFYCDGELFPGNATNGRFEILINISDVYNIENTLVYPCPSSQPNCENKKNPVDLCYTMYHEIGHLFGLSHTLPAPNDGIPNCGYNSPNDVMYWQQGKQPGGCDGNSPRLSANDQCMFRKLYCYGSTDPLYINSDRKGNKPLTQGCFPSGVDHGSLIPSFKPDLKIFPNPSIGEITVEYISNNKGTVMLEIYDVLGNRKFTNVYIEQPGPVSHTINISEFSSGNYIVRATGIDMRGSKLIKLVK
jgi:hypothetical protein